MSDSTVATAIEPAKASALFASMVIQQTNMALIFLGQTPNPETGELIHDLATAKMLIDQLEMLALKSRGNLDSRETALLNQSLTAVRMAYVEAVEKGPNISPETLARDTKPAGDTVSDGDQKSAGNPSDQPPPEEADAESRKKFSKKY
jgi:hypothetical protein